MNFSVSLMIGGLLLNILAMHCIAKSLGEHSSSSSSSSSSSITSSGGTTTNVYQLAATDDVTISQKHNLNDDNFVAIGHMHFQGTARSLLRFQPIPESCKYVAKAELFTFYYRAYLLLEVLAPIFDPTTIHVRQVLSDWNEDEATRIYRKSGHTWYREGLDLNNTDAAKEPEEDSITIHETSSHGYIKFDVTSIAQKWVAGDEDYGVLLSQADEEREGREIHLYSHEAEDVEGMEVKPYLKVTCWSDFCAPQSLRRGGNAAMAEEQETSTPESIPEVREEQSSGSKSKKIISSGGSTFTIPANSYQR